MLTGHLPFDAVDDRDLVQMHVSTRAPELEKYLASAPEGLSAFVASLLVKERAARPANADVARQIAQRIIKRIRSDATAMRPMPSSSSSAAAQPTQKIDRVLEKPHTTTDLSMAAAVRPATGRRVAVAAGLLGLIALAVWALWPRSQVTPPVVEPAPVVAVAPVEPLPVVPVEVRPDVVEPLTPLPTATPIAVKPPIKKSTTVTVQAPAACVFDDKFREYARRTKDDVRSLVNPPTPAFTKAADVLADAMVERDCTKANAALAQMKKIAGSTEE
jgi:hypothetical protein